MAGKVDFQEILAPNATEPLFEFLEHRCNQLLENFIASVRPAIARDIQIEFTDSAGRSIAPYPGHRRDWIQ